MHFPLAIGNFVLAEPKDRDPPRMYWYAGTRILTPWRAELHLDSAGTKTH